MTLLFLIVYALENKQHEEFMWSDDTKIASSVTGDKSGSSGWTR